MRVLKFRAYFHKSTPTSNGDFMLYSPMVTDGERPRVHADATSEPSWRMFWQNVTGFFGRVTIMQWTGLKDHDGVDIYEDDIIKNRTGGLRVIVWRNGAFHSQEIGWRENTGMATHPVYFWALTPDLAPRVIGNIHQNPELVTVKR